MSNYIQIIELHFILYMIYMHSNDSIEEKWKVVQMFYCIAEYFSFSPGSSCTVTIRYEYIVKNQTFLDVRNVLL